MSVPDHYLTLQVESSASDEEIKQAFRRLAKRFHPDKNPGKEKAAERKFKRIIAAYKILSNKRARDVYDKEFEASRTHIKDNRRDNLRKKAKDKTEYMCQLILFELLSKNVQSALEIYESLISKDLHFSFDSYMNDADTRDCEFLLAEAYHKSGSLSNAARLYERVLGKEKKRAYFHGFAQEIEIMLKDVYIQFIAKSVSSEEISANMEKLLAMNLPKRETAWIYKKAAEAYFIANDMDNARRSLRSAYQINPKLTGAKKISSKLGVEGGNPEPNT